MNEKFMNKVVEIGWEILDEYDLNHGNGESYWEGSDRFIMTIEAPNNTTLMVDIDGEFIGEENDDEIKDIIFSEIRYSIRNFDPKEYFNEIWSPGFSISPFRFVEMLQEDEEFFNDLSI